LAFFDKVEYPDPDMMPNEILRTFIKDVSRYFYFKVTEMGKKSFSTLERSIKTQKFYQLKKLQ
jgi:hypothetical protein